MYSIITNGNFNMPIFPYIYFGNAFYIYVGAVMTGISWAVIEDREHYKTLKYMYIAPIRIPAYWLGRGIARFLSGSLAVVITIAFGVLFLHVPLDLARVDWLLFLSLSSWYRHACHHGPDPRQHHPPGGPSLLLIGEAVASALYLFSRRHLSIGRPARWLRPIGFAIPITYWLELMRRSLAGNVAQAFPTLARFSNLQLLGILLGLSVVFAWPRCLCSATAITAPANAA